MNWTLIIECVYFFIGIVYAIYTHKDELKACNDKNSEIEEPMLFIWVTAVAMLWPVSLIIKLIKKLVRWYCSQSG
jgi:tryptophan 2,3-dioxygenase